MGDRYFCTTNLDDYRTTRWPTRFVFPPRIGDRVEGEGYLDLERYYEPGGEHCRFR